MSECPTDKNRICGKSCALYMEESDTQGCALVIIAKRLTWIGTEIQSYVRAPEKQ